MSLLKYFGYDQLKHFLNIVKFHGGWKNVILTTFRNDDVKVGTLMGTDKFGNKYYENNYYFVGRNRWVIYSPKVGFDYDASQIPAEWYGWLHYKTDLLPCQDASRPKYKWMAEHTENMSGTPQQYVPYSTTNRKIEPWVPPKSQKELEK